MPQYQSMKVPVLPVEMSETDEKDFARYILREIDRAEDARSKLERKWNDWLKQYDGRLERPDKIDSWQVDIDIPTTRERAQQATARLKNPILQEDRVFVSQPRTPEMDDFSKAAEDFLDYQTDQWDVDAFLGEIIISGAIYGYSIVKDAWSSITRDGKQWVRVEKVTGISYDPMTGQETPITSQEWEERAYNAPKKSGVFPEVIPVQDFFFPPDSRDIDTAPWVAHRIFLPKHEMRKRIAAGIYNVSLDKLNDKPDQDSIRSTQDKSSGLDTSDVDRYEIYEWWGYYDVDGDGQDEDVIVTIDKRSGVILRKIYNYYHTFCRPFLSWQWESNYNSIVGKSLCQILEPVHRAISAYFCQYLEQASISNGVAWGTDDPEFANKFKNRRVSPGEIILFTSMEKPPAELKLSQPFTALPQILEKLEAHADKLAGLNDYLFGVEQVSRPNASGQMALIEEGKQPLYEKLNSLRRFLSDLGVRILSRYKQWNPEGLEYYPMASDGSLRQAFLFFPEGMIEDKVLIEPKASSANLNENMRRQEMSALMERMSAYWGMQMGLIQQAAMPGNPAGMASLKVAISMREMMNRVLDAFKVPRPELINPDFTAEVIGGLQMALTGAAQGLPGFSGPPTGSGEMEQSKSGEPETK